MMAMQHFRSDAARSQLVDRLIGATGISVERLPALSAVFERLGAECTANLRSLAPTGISLAQSEIASKRLGEALELYEESSIFAVFRAAPREARIVIGANRKFIYGALEAVFGGEGAEGGASGDRSFTSIESRLSVAIFEQVAKALRSAFAPVAEIPLHFEKLETDVHSTMSGRRAELQLVATYSHSLPQQSGELFIIVPQSVLDPFRQDLMAAASSDAPAPDPRWSSQIRREVQRTAVALQAVLDEPELTLDDVARFHIGHVIQLQATAQSRVKVVCNSQTLFWGDLGQSQGNYTLRVQDLVNEEQNFIEDILSA